MANTASDIYSITHVSRIKWRNGYLLAEVHSGPGTQYEVQEQILQPEPFIIFPEVIFVFPADAPDVDILPTYATYHLVSRRMVSLLQDEGVNFEIFPTKLVDLKTKKPLSREYYIFHLQEFVAAIDLEHSQYQYNPLLGIRQIIKIVLRPEFLGQRELHRPLFYDVNRKLNLFIRNDLRRRLETEGISGLTFFSLNDYREDITIEDLTPKTKELRTRQRKKPQWNNPIHRELSEWLADPAEYGEPPIAIETIHQEKSLWPLFEEGIEIAFHRYRMADGQNSIALTGPIIWNFGDTDLEGFSWEELKRFFAGWYIALESVNSPNFDWETNEKEQEVLAQSLPASDAGFMEMMDYIRVGELIWYAYRRKVEGGEQVIITNTTEQMLLPIDSPYLRLPPLYYFLGTLFFEGKLT